MEYKTRLVIQHIDVENFKSYAGKHRIGPFHKTFTSIIGPNGSGKSNVIDALLFVFGRNARKIRLERLSDLIHKSASSDKLTYASVIINFVRIQNDDDDDDNPYKKPFVIPGSQLSIKREVYRSNITQYFINDTKSLQSDVIKCLTREGIDLQHNRFLILQGEVEQIAQMKPKAEKPGGEGLLEYLSDLIGISDMQQSIDEAVERADELQRQRLDALDLEQKVRAEREALDGAKSSTLEFITKDNQLQKTLIVMCQLRMREIDRRLIEPRQILASIKEKIELINAEVIKALAKKKEKEEEILNYKKELTLKTTERDKNREYHERIQLEYDQLKQGLEDNSNLRLKLQSHKEKVSSEIKEIEMQSQDAEKNITLHTSLFTEESAKVDNLQLQYDQKGEELEPLLIPLRQELEKIKLGLIPFQDQVMEAKEHLNGLEDKMHDLEEVHSKNTEDICLAEAQKRDFQQRIADILEIQGRMNNESSKVEISSLQKKINDYTQTKLHVNQQIEEIKRSYREGEADDRVTEFLISQRSLKGYYGTLRQLGKIESEYDIAAGVASNAWGFHVVEDRETATQVISLLKEHNIGRVSIMILKEIEKNIGRQMDSKFKMVDPEVRRLFDLIKPTNQRFCCAFYQAVRNTLVVADLKAARELAVSTGKTYRMVTRAGELIEPSGSITGGGARPRGAKLTASRSPQDKRHAKDELERLQKVLVEAVTLERRCKEELQLLQQRMPKLSRDQVQRLQEELGVKQTKLEMIDKQLKLHYETRESVTSVKMESKRQQLQNEIQEARSSFERAENMLLNQQQQIVRLNADMNQIGGEAFLQLKHSLDEAVKRHETEASEKRRFQKSLTRLGTLMERKQRELSEISEKLNELNISVKDKNSEQLEAVKKAMSVCSKDLTTSENALQQVVYAMESVRQDLPSLHKDWIKKQSEMEDEERHYQTEAAKVAVSLQELAKFTEKIDGCEAKIRENAELYGLETLPIAAKSSKQKFPRIEEQQSPHVTHEQDAPHSLVLDHSGSLSEDSTESDSDDNETINISKRKRIKRGRSNDAQTEDMEISQACEWRVEDLPTMFFKATEEELERCNYEHSVHLAKALSEETKRLQGAIDFRAVSLWRERDTEHRRTKEEYEKVKKLSDESEMLLLNLKETRKEAFLAKFTIIQQKLRIMYQLLTNGGDAEMELIDMNDPFEGINFIVRPPKKSWKQVSNLSGGEKTLSSLALVFSLQHVKPTPIYVLDEIDAALDFRNVSIVANYILRESRGAQFIIISLRNNMFELAHELLGVFKQCDITRTIHFLPHGFKDILDKRNKASLKEDQIEENRIETSQISIPSHA